MSSFELIYLTKNNSVLCTVKNSFEIDNVNKELPVEILMNNPYYYVTLNIYLEDGNIYCTSTEEIGTSVVNYFLNAESSVIDNVNENLYFIDTISENINNGGINMISNTYISSLNCPTGAFGGLNVSDNLIVSQTGTFGNVLINNMIEGSGVISGYIDSGKISNPPLKIWCGTGTTDSSGIFTIDISSASFNTIYSVIPTAISSSGEANANLTTLNSVSTSSISGMIVKGTSSVGLGNTLVSGPSSITIYLTVYGV